MNEGVEGRDGWERELKMFRETRWTMRGRHENKIRWKMRDDEGNKRWKRVEVGGRERQKRGRGARTSNEEDVQRGEIMKGVLKGWRKMTREAATS